MNVLPNNWVGTLSRRRTGGSLPPNWKSTNAYSTRWGYLNVSRQIDRKRITPILVARKLPQGRFNRVLGHHDFGDSRRRHPIHHQCRQLNCPTQISLIVPWSGFLTPQALVDINQRGLLKLGNSDTGANCLPRSTYWFVNHEDQEVVSWLSQLDTSIEETVGPVSQVL
jgi:hypothetical protein